MSLMKQPLGMERHHLYELSPFSSLICRLLPLAKPWRSLWSAQTAVLHTQDTCVCLVLWWSAGEVKMETTEPAAIFPVAAQCIRMCFLLRAKEQRFGLSLGCIHAILQLVCLWWERHSERRTRHGYVSYVNARAGRSFWPALCHSGFRTCSNSCMLEYWSLCC